jgi:hypothetical protein
MRDHYFRKTIRDYLSHARDWPSSLRILLFLLSTVFLAVFTWPIRVATPQSPSRLLIPERVLRMSPGELKSRNQDCVAAMKEIESLSRQKPRTAEDLKELEAKLERAVKALSTCDARIPALVLEDTGFLAAAEVIARRDGLAKVKAGGLSSLPGGSELKARIKAQVQNDGKNLRSALNAIKATVDAFHKANLDQLKEDAKRRRAALKDPGRRSETTNGAADLKPALLQASFLIEDLDPPAYAQERQGPVTILACGGKVGDPVECTSDFVFITYLIRKFGEASPPSGGGPSVMEQCFDKAQADYDYCRSSVGPGCDRSCDAAGSICDITPFVDKAACKSSLKKACEVTCDAAGQVACVAALGAAKASCVAF